MVASFMPSMAFAANTNSGHTFYKYNEHYTVVNGEAKAIADRATQAQIDKYVEVVSAPTCTTAGSAVSKCNTPLPEGVACDETITETIPAGHSWSTLDMSVEEFAAKLVAQKSETEAEAKAWVKKQKDMCHVAAKRCTICGEVKTIAEGSSVVAHDYTGDKTCASTVQCSYTGCTAMINTPAGKKLPGGHDTDGVDDTTKTVACGGITKTGKVCKKCGEFVVNVGGETGNAKCNAYVGDIPAGAATKSIDGTKVFYNGKKIADIKSGKVTCVPGYYYDANRDVFVKADTVVGNKHGYTCSKCGYVQTLGNQSVAVGCSHAWSKVTVDATCKAPAQEYMVCTECGKYKTVADPDDVVGVTKAEATKAVTGSKALGHALEVKEVAGDCHDTAKYVVKCTRSGCNEKIEVTAANFKTLPEGTSLYVNPAAENISAETTNIVGSAELKYLSATTTDDHKFTKKVTVKAATCENNEIVAYVCDTCGKLNVHTSTIVPGTKLAHEIEKVDTPATCKMTAGSVEKCKNCDYEKVLVKAEPIKGGEHSGEVWKVTKKATVFEEGVKTLVCAACGEELGAKTPVAIAKYAAPAVKAGKKSATVTVKATADAVSYKISYKKAGGSYKTIAAKAGKKTIKKLAKGKKYTFKAIAVNAEGVEVASATKTVKVK